MRLLSLLATAAWITLAATAPALADPLTGAIAAIAGIFSGTGLGAVVGRLLISVALQVGASLLQKAFAKKRLSGGINTQVQVGGDVPRSVVVGRYPAKGSFSYPPKTWGGSGDTPNAHLVLVIPLSDMPVGGLRRLFINGEAVTISETPHAFAGYAIEEYQIDGGTYAYVKFYDGTQTTADSYLLDKFGDDPDHPFLSDMIGRGIAYAIMTFVRDDNEQPDLWSGIPDCLFELDGIPLYDRREDDTAGGEGDQRLSDPSTWTSSANPYVIAENILRGLEYDDVWQWGMQGLAPAALPFDEWVAAANAADLAIDLDAGGTEPQFQYGREIAYSDQPVDLLDDILASAQGRTAECGGIYKPLCGVPGAAVYAFTDEDVVITAEQELDPFPGAETTHNGAKATYIEPADSWAVRDAPAYLRSDLEEEDQDFRLTAELQFGGVSSNTQVQRLLKAAVEDARRMRRHVLTLPPETWIFEPNDVVAWTSARNGYSAKLFLVTMKDELANGNQVFGLLEIDPADYDWTPATDERTYVTYPVVRRRPDPQAIVDWYAEPWEIEDSSGAGRRPAIRISWDGTAPDVSGVEWEVRLDGETEVVVDGRTERYTAGAANISHGLLPNEDYEVRGRYIPATRRRVSWSDWLDVTTPDTRLGGDDFYPIDLDVFREELRDDLEWGAVNTRDVIQRYREMALMIADQDLANFADKQTIRRQFVDEREGLKASYTEAIDAATGPGSALVQRIQALEAEFSGFVTVELLNVQIARIDTNESGITALGANIATIEIDLAGKATIASLNEQIVRIDDNEDGLSVLGTNLSSLEAEVDDKATIAALNAQIVRIDDNEDGLSLLGADVTALEAEVDGKASVAALDALEVQVNANEDDIDVLASSLTSLQATVDDVSAQANIRMQVSAGVAGYSSQIQIQARVGGSGSFRAAALIIDVPALTSLPTRLRLVAQQVVVTTTGGTIAALFDGDTTYLNNARIRNLTATNITVGSLTGDRLAVGTITADRLVLGGLTYDRFPVNEITRINAIVANTNYGYGPGHTAPTIGSWVTVASAATGEYSGGIFSGNLGATGNTLSAGTYNADWRLLRHPDNTVLESGSVVGSSSDTSYASTGQVYGIAVRVLTAYANAGAELRFQIKVNSLTGGAYITALSSLAVLTTRR